MGNMSGAGEGCGVTARAVTALPAAVLPRAV